MFISYENKKFNIIFSGRRIFLAGGEIELDTGKKIDFSDYIIVEQKNAIKVTSVNEGLEISYLFSCPNENFLRIETEVKNISANNFKIKEIDIVGSVTSEVFSEFDRIMITGESMISLEGVLPLDKNYTSTSYLAFTQKHGNGAFLAGFTDSRKTYHIVKNYLEDSSVKGFAIRDNVPLNSNETLKMSAFVLGFDKSLSVLLDNYADFLAKDGEAVVPKELKTGWCSWYYYYSFESEEDIINNIKMLKKSPIGNKIKVIQIDDGWSLSKNGVPHTWGDWFPGSKFPKGMKYIADTIHSYGYEAGIWLAPFTVSSTSNLAINHPEWIVKGNEIDNVGAVDSPLDLSNPEVIDFIRETFIRVFDEWGYDYIKIDFLVMAMFPGERFNKNITRAEAYYNALKIIKDVAKDRFVLTCGPSTFQTVGVTDGIRIGPDVGNRWVLPYKNPNLPNGNLAIKPAMYNTLWKNWMHNKLWHNDADCLMARNHENPYERILYGDTICGVPWQDDFFGITDEVFNSWIRTLWMTSNMLLLSEVWDELPKDRQKLIARCFPPLSRPVEYIDYYINPEIVLLKTKETKDSNEPLIIGVFNMSDNAIKVEIPSDIIKCGNWKFVEHFNNESFFGKGGVLSFPELKAHSSNLWVLQK